MTSSKSLLYVVGNRSYLLNKYLMVLTFLSLILNVWVRVMWSWFPKMTSWKSVVWQESSNHRNPKNSIQEWRIMTNNNKKHEREEPYILKWIFMIRMRIVKKVLDIATFRVGKQRSKCHRSIKNKLTNAKWGLFLEGRFDFKNLWNVSRKYKISVSWNM